MENRFRHGTARVLSALCTLVLCLLLLPPLGVQAAQLTVKIDTGASLESALAATFAQQGETPYEEIERLVITGNGQLTEADGLFIRERLTNLDTLNLRGFTGTSGNAAFQGCISLRTVMLPERFVISREMFYGCTALEEVVWPVRYQLTKDCFAYCALDFSEGYPNLLNDENVLTYAANQRPKVYFALPRGRSGSIGAGESFEDPYELQTRSGESFTRLLAQKPKWLLTRESELEVSRTITRDGEVIRELDTAETGKYEITYALPYATYADTRTQSYTLTIQPSHQNLGPLIRDAKALQEKGFTAESWATLESALAEAERLMEGNGVQQSALDAARVDLDKALAGLQIELEGAPETALTVGDSFTLAPGKNGGLGRSNWEWDDTMLAAEFAGGASFTAQKAGETEIVYRGSDGIEGRLALRIVEEGESAPAPAQPTAKPAARGERGLWIFAGILFLAIALVLLAAFLLQRKNKPSQEKTEEKK